MGRMRQKMGFMNALKEKAKLSVGKRQKRSGGKRIWEYTGFSLSA